MYKIKRDVLNECLNFNSSIIDARREKRVDIKKFE